MNTQEKIKRIMTRDPTDPFDNWCRDLDRRAEEYVRASATVCDCCGNEMSGGACKNRHCPRFKED